MREGEEEKGEDDLLGGEYRAEQAQPEWRVAEKDIVLGAVNLLQRQSLCRAGGEGCEEKHNIV